MHPSHREVGRNPDTKIIIGKVIYLPFLLREYKGSRKAIRGEKKSDEDAGQEYKKSEEDIRGRLFNRGIVVHGDYAVFNWDYVFNDAQFLIIFLIDQPILKINCR